MATRTPSTTTRTPVDRASEAVHLRAEALSRPVRCVAWPLAGGLLGVEVREGAIRILVDELVDLDPSLQVLFVAPAVDILHELRRAGSPSRSPAPRLGPGSTPGSTCCGPASGCPGWWAPSPTGRWNGQVLEAVNELGLPRPLLWINDASYAALAVRTGWPSLYDITDDWLLAPHGPAGSGTGWRPTSAPDGAQPGGGGVLARSGPLPGQQPCRGAHSQRGGRRPLPHRPAPTRRSSSFARWPSTSGHCTPGGSTSRWYWSWPGPAPTSRSSWSGRTALPTTSPTSWSGSRTSACSGPVPTTRSRPTCSTPT